MVGTNAVVVGASMAGLAVAAALARSFDRVTLLDRDTLPEGAAHRQGVPQDRHLHLLLPSGAAALEELLPGILDEMVGAGAFQGDSDRIRLSLEGHRLAPAAAGLRAMFATRPFVESHVRRRVRALPGVRFVEGSTANGLLTDATGGRVTGVRAVGEDGEPLPLPAALVVDCSGRGSRAGTWLEELGYEPPTTDELRVDVRYSTRTLQLPDDALDGDHHVLVGPSSHHPHGGAMTHVGPDRWLVTLFTVGSDGDVPADEEGFRRVAADLPVPDIHDAVVEGEPEGPLTRYRFPANQRRRFERARRGPEGFIVAGDAVCSFNPIYGQGMSVAALEAVALTRLLREQGQVPEPADWFEAITPIVDGSWELAVGSDLALDVVEGRRPLSVRLGNAYLRAFHAAAADDPLLTERFVRVAGLVDPPSALLRPAVLARVVGARLRRRVSGSTDGR